MKNFAVISAEPSDALVLGDLLRVYFPGVVPQHYFSDDSVGNNGEEEDNVVRIRIEEIQNPLGFKVCLDDGRKTYRGQLQASATDFGEIELNKRRRLLRLCVHQALSSYVIEQGRMVSPWAILTGVRPTKIVHRLLRQGFSTEEAQGILIQEYGLDFQKARLVTAVAGRQLPYLHHLKRDDQVSVYISIPFCPTRCHYCSFPAFALDRWGGWLEGYLANLSQEIQASARAMDQRGLGVQTIYVGGGTPTVLSAEQIRRLLGLIREEFHLARGTEITVEAGRPDTLSREKLQVLKEFGVERISINPQTFHEQTLQTIGRRHSPQDIMDAFNLAREIGFKVINMDLIIGLPGENRQVLAETLEQVLRLRPENITLHALALKRAAFFKQEGVSLPDPEEGAKMTVAAQQTLEAAGYYAYYLYRQKEIAGHGENVGYCLPGTASLYNILMMEEEQTILGFGVGASSKFIDPLTRAVDNVFNPKDLIVYQERLPQLTAIKVDKIGSFG